MKKSTEPVWKTAPIRSTCEVDMRGVGPCLNKGDAVPQYCDAPTTHAYPARGGGWMSLCRKHATKHITNGQSSAISTDLLIKRGERWE